MSLTAALATTSEAVGLANGIKSLIKGKGDRDRLRPVLNALQAIYFTPNGVLTVLTAIQQGRTPSRTEVTACITDFNDGEWQVQKAAEVLNFEMLQRFDLPLKHRNLLQAAVVGKLSLRRDLQDVVNTPSDKLDLQRDQAGELVARILELNSAIENLDEALRG